MRNIPLLIVYTLIIVLTVVWFGISNALAGTNHRNSGVYETMTSNLSIDGIKFTRICRINDTPGEFVWIEIWQEGVAVIATSTIYDVNDLSQVSSPSEEANCTSEFNHTFQFASDINLTNGIKYHFVIQATNNNPFWVVLATTSPEYDYYTATACDYDVWDCTESGTHKIIVDIGSYDLLTTGSSLVWHFPKQDYELTNSEWNDWGLFYDLDADDLGNWNILMVHYTDPNGTTYTDWDLITTTTELVYWTVDRENNLTDGLVYSQAQIAKIEDCDNYVDDNCIWTDVAETGYITWVSSSTAYTIFDAPYYLPGFDPASTTVAGEQAENVGFLGGLYRTLARLFPLSLFDDVYQEFKQAELREGTESKVNFTLDSLIPPEYGLDFGTSTVILSEDIISDSLPVWDTKIYPSMETLIWLFTFVYILIFGLKVFKHD